MLFPITFAFSQIQNPAPYCASDFSNSPFPLTDYFIESVTLKNVALINKTSQTAAPNYTYYNNGPVQDLAKNTQVSITIDFSGSTMHYIDAWIDFNKNNAFEANENIGFYDRINDPNLNMGNTTKTFNFTVPANAVNGSTRLRVRVIEDDDVFFSNPSLPATLCSQYANGETLDFNVNITNALYNPEFSQNEITLYPNPVNDILTIAIKDDTKSTVRLCNNLGQIQAVKPVLFNDTMTISVSHLPKGIYFITVSSEEKVSTKKVVKN